MSKGFVMQTTTTVNPAGAPTLTNTSTSISPPQPDVVAKQDPRHTEADFMSDLDKATRQRQTS
jgi:hypothetical protein